jgi:hypothetical protein
LAKKSYNVGYLAILGDKHPSHYKAKKRVCKILGFHGGDYEEFHISGCYAIWLF